MQKSKEIEMVFGIYHGKKYGGYNGPVGDRQAGCVIHENQADEDLLRNLVASDFLSQWNEYVVIDNGTSIHIHHKEGAIALVLIYEEDIEPLDSPRVKTFKLIDAECGTAEEKLEALTQAGFDLEEIFDIAMCMGE